MSTLTKVFAVLVSFLAIFVCGVVVTYITNTHDWKTGYYEKDTITKAAQIQALAAEMDRTKSIQRNQLYLQRIQDGLAAIQQINSELSRQLATEKQAAADKSSQAETAVQTVKALRETIQNMYDAQLELQKALDGDRAKMIAAQTQMIDLTRQLNSLRVENDQVKTKWKREIEKNYQLEEENATLQQRVEKVTIGSTEFRPDRRVSLTTPVRVGVPIRGEIMEVRGEKVAISVGSSSGVRNNMTFLVTRADKFLGNLKIIHVDPSASVGELDNQQGAIAKGDKVTTGFD